MMERRKNRAVGILEAIGTGTMPTAPFTDDARWWWNGGLDLALGEFGALLGELHALTESGIAVTPGLILADGDSVVVEATSHARLRSGQVYDNRYLFLFHFEGDAVREVREYSDSAHVNAVFDLSG